MQKHILIVEDEPAIRDMLAYALRKGDYAPLLAGDNCEVRRTWPGVEALATLSATSSSARSVAKTSGVKARRRAAPSTRS